MHVLHRRQGIQQQQSTSPEPFLDPSPADGGDSRLPRPSTAASAPLPVPESSDCHESQLSHSNLQPSAVSVTKNHPQDQTNLCHSLSLTLLALPSCWMCNIPHQPSSLPPLPSDVLPQAETQNKNYRYVTFYILTEVTTDCFLLWKDIMLADRHQSTAVQCHIPEDNNQFTPEYWGFKSCTLFLYTKQNHPVTYLWL